MTAIKPFVVSTMRVKASKWSYLTPGKLKNLNEEIYWSFLLHENVKDTDPIILRPREMGINP